MREKERSTSSPHTTHDAGPESLTTRRTFLTYAGSCGLFAMAGLLRPTWPANVAAVPLGSPYSVKGRTPWAVILCRFNDLPALTIPTSDFSDFVAGPGQGGVFDYFKDVSYGTIDLTGSKVFGWYTMKYSFFNEGNQGRNVWIGEAIRLAKENGVDMSPYYGVIAVVNANVDDSASGKNLALGIMANWGQNNWRWCKKCEVLNYGGNPAAACPKGGVHDLSGSWDYSLAMNMPGFPGQNNWRWCKKCQGLAYAGFTAGRCPAGGTHDHSSSADYRIALGKAGFPGQNNWRWCKKCQGLSFAGDVPGACAGGGTHDRSSSGDYTLVAPHFGYVSHFNVSFAAHEMGHCYGLGHAKCAAKSAEYCNPWDIMGAGTATYTPDPGSKMMYVTKAEKFAPLGPGLCGPNLQRLGWLPDDRVRTVTPGTSTGGTIQLVALNRPDLKGPLMAKIVAPGRVITAEFRKRYKWDRGLPTDAVIIHEIREGGEPFLLGDYGAGQRWADLAKGISVVVDRINSAASTATIVI